LRWDTSRCGHKGIDVDIMSTSGMTYIQMLGEAMNLVELI